jgi:hypothetical protein
MKIKLMGSQTDLTSATSVGNASLVRVFNGTNAAILMTQKAGSAVVGTMSVGAGAVEHVIKQPAHTLEGGAGLKVVHVSHKS